MTETPRRTAQAKMQHVLARLGLPLKVAWTPNGNHDKHGLIEPSSKTLFIFDEGEEEAWQTLIHEILEFKLKGVTSHYRNVINGLIEIIEKSCYQQKEEFLEFIPQVVEEVKKFEQKT
jgi:hypothetical protein